MANEKGLTRSVTVKNVQVKPANNIPISRYEPPKPVTSNRSTTNNTR